MSAENAPIVAGVVFEDGELLSHCLADVVEQLRSRGLRVVGSLQRKRQGGEACCDAVEVEDLGLDQRVDVTENRGKGAEGCRLDIQALAKVVESIEMQIDSTDKPVDLVMVNRFGQAESEGRGMRAALNSAVSKSLPVLVAVKPRYLDDWNEWHQGGAVNLKPDADAIIDWFDCAEA